jgi:hypothetical protein
MALAVGVVVVVLGSPVQAQTASALLREGDELPGAPGETVSFINNPVVNHAGGYAVTVNTTGSGTTLGNIWGNATGGAGTVIITEGLYGDLQQTSFESFHGFSNAGVPAYSAISTNVVTGVTGLDGAWLGTMVVLNEDDPVPSLSDTWSTFNSRVAVSADGIPYWVGGITKTQGSSTQNRALFYSTGAISLLMGGDSIGGVAEPVETGSSNIDFDYRFSELATFYLTPVNVDSSSTSDGVLVINGDAVFLGGSIVREASPVPASIGGLPGENWDNFDNMGITEAGVAFFTGDTSASSTVDEFVVVAGQIVLREGDTVNTPGGPATLKGSIEGGYMNENEDWAVIWDVDTVAGNVEALLVNGEALLLEGDAVDLDGDGVPEPNSILRNFTGIASLVMSDRDGVGVASVYFTADIDTKGTSSSSDDIEGMFRLNVQLGVPAIELPLDIKPHSCPNSFNTGSQGVLPVALVGTMDFDVDTVDLATVRIARMGGGVAPNEGPPGPHSVIEDVATPFEGETCDCDDLGGDMIPDLMMFFQSELLTPALGLGQAPGGSMVELTVTGMLLDGTPFFATDCVRVVPPDTTTTTTSGKEDENSNVINVIDPGVITPLDRSFR